MTEQETRQNAEGPRVHLSKVIDVHAQQNGDQNSNFTVCEKQYSLNISFVKCY